MGTVTNWVRVCALDELPPLGARVLLIEGLEPIALFRTADDEVFALRDRCPHKGGPLSQGIVSGRSVACPLHNWNIGLDDGHACAPDVGCAPRYPVKIEDAVVWIVPVAAEQPQAEPA
ncbi:MAG: nitrite reductase small subunit NirD [Pseudomonas sp.]